jgi:hypothetical protein
LKSRHAKLSVVSRVARQAAVLRLLGRGQGGDTDLGPLSEKVNVNGSGYASAIRSAPRVRAFLVTLIAAIRTVA